MRKRSLYKKYEELFNSVINQIFKMGKSGSSTSKMKKLIYFSLFPFLSTTKIKHQKSQKQGEKKADQLRTSEPK